MRDFLTSHGLMAGLVLLAIGYLLLLATDPMGRNWASHLSPVLIMAGIGLAAAQALRKE